MKKQLLSKCYQNFIKNLNSKKQIQKHKKFLIQGLKSVNQAIESNWPIESLLMTESYYAAYRNLVDNYNCNKFIISDELLCSLGDLCSNKDVIAVADYKPVQNSSIDDQSIIVLSNIQDPGNLGTIIRIADWFGIKKIVCSENSVYSYNSKVIQASMGSFLRVDVCYTNLYEFLSSSKLAIYGADLNGESIYDAKFSKHGIFLFGSESHGICNSLKPLITQKITIPSFSEAADSLNVGIAAGIVISFWKKNHNDS